MYFVLFRREASAASPAALLLINRTQFKEPLRQGATPVSRDDSSLAAGLGTMLATMYSPGATVSLVTFKFYLL
jgi:hypothetical protein